MLKGPIIKSDQKTVLDRSAGSESISARAKALGADNGLVLECVWDIGQDVRIQHAHRLDLSTATGSVRLYFSDPELAPTVSDARKKRTEQRLRDAIVQLVPRSPAPTYATSTRDNAGD